MSCINKLNIIRKISSRGFQNTNAYQFWLSHEKINYILDLKSFQISIPTGLTRESPVDSCIELGGHS